MKKRLKKTNNYSAIILLVFFLAIILLLSYSLITKKLSSSSQAAGLSSRAKDDYCVKTLGTKKNTHFVTYAYCQKFLGSLTNACPGPWNDSLLGMTGFFGKWREYLSIFNLTNTPCEFPSSGKLRYCCKLNGSILNTSEDTIMNNLCEESGGPYDYFVGDSNILWTYKCKNNYSLDKNNTLPGNRKFSCCRTEEGMVAKNSSSKNSRERTGTRNRRGGNVTPTVVPSSGSLYPGVGLGALNADCRPEGSWRRCDDPSLYCDSSTNKCLNNTICGNKNQRCCGKFIPLTENSGRWDTICNNPLICHLGGTTSYNKFGENGECY